MKTKLDLILDTIHRNQTEVTFDTDGYTSEQVQRLIDTAKARNLRVSYDGRFVLVRDMD